ncbi:hypothetical protein [Prescottella subtropica]|uniref:hypothetical protein n=1 Tax=Prescottella subtropica TaxID=2545757 RepID=UPI0010FA4DB4|nr:hypothetical protein [Prescottella subtropica]
MSATGIGVAVVAAAAGLTASLVWVLAGTSRPGAGGVFHGPTRSSRLRERMQVLRAARSMNDAELEEAIRALTDTADRLLVEGRAGEATRVVEDLRVCLSVFGGRQQAGGPTAL